MTVLGLVSSSAPVRDAALGLQRPSGQVAPGATFDAALADLSRAAGGERPESRQGAQVRASDDESPSSAVRTRDRSGDADRSSEGLDGSAPHEEEAPVSVPTDAPASPPLDPHMRATASVSAPGDAAGAAGSAPGRAVPEATDGGADAPAFEASAAAVESTVERPARSGGVESEGHHTGRTAGIDARAPGAADGRNPARTPLSDMTPPEGGEPLHEAGHKAMTAVRLPLSDADRQALPAASRGPGEEPRVAGRAEARPPESGTRDGIQSGAEPDGAAADGGQERHDSSSERQAPIVKGESGAGRPSVRAFQSALTFVQAADGGMSPAAVPAAQSATASSMTPQARAANLGQLVQSMQVLVRNGIGEATIRLRPEHLGEVTLAVRVDGRSVSATVRAESPGVREWLQMQEDALRAGLAQHGLSLDRLVIQRDARHDRNEQEPSDTRRHRPRPRADGTERFEVSA